MVAATLDLTEEQRERLANALRPKTTFLNVAEPLSPKQQAALLLNHVDEVLYGGAAGGGKSSWLLHAAAQYADIPGYSAVIFRRTYGDLAEAGAIMDRSKLWWSQMPGAHWEEGRKRWIFECPGGGTSRLAFRHMDKPSDWMRYQGPEFQFVGFDEVTQFVERQYTYLFSRLRKPKPPEQWELRQWERLPEDQKRIVGQLSSVPLRMRAASNPGGPGHEWVKERFGIYLPSNDPGCYACQDEELECEHKLHQRREWIFGIDPETGHSRNRIFLPAKVRDNPGLNLEEYIKTLQHLDPTTRSQYLDGDWDAREPGEFYQRQWFPIMESTPQVTETARYWDLAASEAHPGRDPDWTAGVKLARLADGRGWIVLDVQHFRKRSFDVEELVKQTAFVDGRGVMIGMEQEGGASGKSYLNHYQRSVLTSFALKPMPSSGDKTTRARPVAAKAESRMIYLLRAPWNREFLNELEAFPTGSHDDMVDALSGAFEMLEGRKSWRAL